MVVGLGEWASRSVTAATQRFHEDRAQTLKVASERAAARLGEIGEIRTLGIDDLMGQPGPLGSFRVGAIPQPGPQADQGISDDPLLDETMQQLIDQFRSRNELSRTPFTPTPTFNDRLTPGRPVPLSFADPARAEAALGGRPILDPNGEPSQLFEDTYLRELGGRLRRGIDFDTASDQALQAAIAIMTPERPGVGPTGSELLSEEANRLRELEIAQNPELGEIPGNVPFTASGLESAAAETAARAEALPAIERFAKRYLDPAAALGQQVIESPVGSSIPGVSELKGLQEASGVAADVLEDINVPEAIRVGPATSLQDVIRGAASVAGAAEAVLPRDKTFAEAAAASKGPRPERRGGERPDAFLRRLEEWRNKTSGFVSPFKAWFGNDEEIAKAEGVLQESGFPRALAAQIIFDPFNALPGLGFTKVEDVFKLGRMVLKATSTTSTRARTLAVETLRNSDLIKTALRDFAREPERGGAVFRLEGGLPPLNTIEANLTKAQTRIAALDAEIAAKTGKKGVKALREERVVAGADLARAETQKNIYDITNQGTKVEDQLSQIHALKDAEAVKIENLERLNLKAEALQDRGAPKPQFGPDFEEAVRRGEIGTTSAEKARIASERIEREAARAGAADSSARWETYRDFLDDPAYVETAEVAPPAQVAAGRMDLTEFIDPETGLPGVRVKSGDVVETPTFRGEGVRTEAQQGMDIVIPKPVPEGQAALPTDLAAERAADVRAVAHADARPTRIMNLDVKIEKSQRVGGVDYELYRATRPGEDGAVIRVVDDSGNVVSTGRYPTFAAADTEYVKATDAARLADAPARQAAAAPTVPHARGTRVDTPLGEGTVVSTPTFEGVKFNDVRLDNVPPGRSGNVSRFRPEELTPIETTATPAAPVRGTPTITESLPTTPPKKKVADQLRNRYKRAKTDATRKNIESEWMKAHGLEKVPVGSGWGRATDDAITAAPREQIDELLAALRGEAVAPTPPATGATVPKAKLVAPEPPTLPEVPVNPPPPGAAPTGEPPLTSPITASPRRAIAAPTGAGQIAPPPETRALVPIAVEEGSLVGESIFRSPAVLDQLARETADEMTRIPRAIQLPPPRAEPIPSPGPRRFGLDNTDEIFADVKAAAQNHVRATDAARAAAEGRVPPIDPPNPPGGMAGGPDGPGQRPPRPFGESPDIGPDLPAGRAREIIDEANEVYRGRVLTSNANNSAIGDSLEFRERQHFTFDGDGNFTDETITSSPPGHSLEFHDVIQRPHDYVWATPEAKQLAEDLAAIVERKTVQAEDAGVAVRRQKRPPDESYFPRTATEIEGERIPGAGKQRRGIGARQQHTLPRVNEFAETTRTNGVDLLNSPAREVEVYLKGVDRTIIDAEYARVINKFGQTPAQRIAKVFKEAVIATTRKRNQARTVLNRLRKTAISRSPERAPNVNALRSFKKRLETRLVNAKVNEAKVTTAKAKAKWRLVQRTLGDEIKDAQRRIDDAIKEGRGGLKGRIKSAEDQLGTAEAQLKTAKSERARQIDIARRPRGKQEALIREPFASTRVFPRETARAVERGFKPGTPGAVTKVLEASNEVSNIFRPLWAAGDLSYTALQTATGAGLNPAAYAKMQAVVLSSLADPSNYYRYVDENIDIVLEATSRGMPWGGHEFTFEDALAGPLGDQIDKIIRVTGLKMGNDAFTRALNVMTTELYKQGRAIALDIGESNMSKLVRTAFGPVAKGEDGLTQLTAVVANLSGRMSLPAAARLGPTQALFLRALPFAGRYYTAWVGLVAKAVTSYGLDGNIARRALLTFAGGMGGAYWLTGKVIGQEPHWDLDGKFMTYSVAGQNVGPGGILYGFIRLGGQIADDPGNAPAIVARWARGRSSPAVSILWDAISGQDFTFDRLDSPGAIAEYIAKLPLPFAAQSAVEVALEGEGPAGVAATFASEFIGGRAFPRSPFQDRDDAVANWAKANNITDEDGNTPTRYRDLNKAQKPAFKETEAGQDIQEAILKATKNFDDSSQESFEAIADVRERLVSDPATAAVFGLTTTQEQDNSLLARNEIDGRQWRERLSERLDKLRTIRALTEDETIRERLGIDFEIKEPDAGSVDAMIEAYFDVVPGEFTDDTGEIDWDAYFTAKDAAFARATRKGGEIVEDFLRPFEEDATMRRFREAKDLRNQVESIPKYQELSANQGEIMDEFLDAAGDLVDRWFRETGITYPLILAIRAEADFNAERDGGSHESGWSWENIKGWAILLRPGSRTRDFYSDPARDNFIQDNAEPLLTFYPELSQQLSRPQIAGLSESQFETALTQR